MVGVCAHAAVWLGWQQAVDASAVAMCRYSAQARLQRPNGSRWPQQEPVCHAVPCCAAGDVYEQAVLVALKSQNEDAQESAFTQLKTLYDDTR